MLIMSSRGNGGQLCLRNYMQLYKKNNNNDWSMIATQQIISEFARLDMTVARGTFRQEQTVTEVGKQRVLAV